MFCKYCGITLSENAQFCQGCGKDTNDLSAPITEIPSEVQQSFVDIPRPSFRRTRIMNWGIAFLLGVGSIGTMLQARTPEGALLVLLFCGFIFGFTVVTAVALGEQDFSMFNIYISISSKLRTNFQKISLVWNWIIGGFGIIGLIACVATQQYLPMISMLVFALPPYLNIKALRALKKFAYEHNRVMT